MPMMYLREFGAQSVTKIKTILNVRGLSWDSCFVTVYCIYLWSASECYCRAPGMRYV